MGNLFMDVCIDLLLTAVAKEGRCWVSGHKYKFFAPHVIVPSAIKYA